MAETYHLLSWIIDSNELKRLHYLITLADDLGCELRWDQIVGIGQTQEGYSTLEIIVCIPSQEATITFFQKLNSNTKFTNWKPISEEDYDSVSHYRYYETPTLQQVAGTLPFNSQIDGFRESGVFNRELREVLNNDRIIYFCFDWIIPFPFVRENKVKSDYSEEFHNAYFDSALGDVMDAAAKLGIGREVRSVESIENETGLLGKRMVIRGFAEDEIEQFKNKISPFETYNWQAVDEQVFLTCAPLVNTDLLNLYYSLQRKSRFNNKRSSA